MSFRERKISIWGSEYSLESFALLLSCVLLSISALAYPDLFLFNKVVHLPGWADSLPYSMFAGSYIALLALLPISLCARSKVRLLGYYLVAALATVGPASLVRHVDDGLWMTVVNILFHYAFAMAFYLSVPMALWMALRIFLDRLYRA